jgi:iron complex outermembrane receptor protein
MNPARLPTFAFVIALLFTPFLWAQDGKGHIDGRVTRTDGSPLAGVGVVLEGTSLFALTDGDGRFEFRSVRAGTYSLTFTLLDNSVTRPDVVVTARSSTTIDQVVDWQVAYLETVTVRSVSRRRERIVDAPASVTSVSQKEIARQASHGQTPKLFEFTPGMNITQINLTDFLVDTRGFNSGLNRRLAVLVDGRDTSDPFVGAPEWATLSLPLDDLAALEVLRGPTAALYGANATGGIITLNSSEPRNDPGGQIRLAPGERNSMNVDFRWAGGLGKDWYMKALAGYRTSDGFSVSRAESVEYSVPCDPGADPPLIRNCIPLDSPDAEFDDNIDIRTGGLRFDKYLPNGNLFTIEGGTTEYNGSVFISGVGRGQIRDVQRPWGRANFSAKHWNLLAYYNGRDAEARNLTTNRPFTTDAYNFKIEFQTNWDFAGEKVRLVGGGSYMKENIESNAQLGAAEIDEQALFAQVDWNATRHLKLVGALRWDDSTLHDARVSPKGSIVYRVNPRHSLRLTYNEAFQVPTIADLYLYFNLPVGTDLSELNDVCLTYAGVDCGLTDSTTTLILGNESLDVEEVTTLEFGYKGILGEKAFVGIDVYDSRNQNFVVGGLFQIGPDGQRTNPNFGPWVGPSEAETTLIDPADCNYSVNPGDTVADCVRAGALELLVGPNGGPALTNFDEDAIVLLFSSTTFGKVDTRGADLAFGYFFDDNWRLNLSYSWFEFDIVDDVGGVRDLLQPNAPENKAALTLSYDRTRWDAYLRGRWVEGFPWYNSATFTGFVESYTTVDLSGNYAFNNHWTVGANIANVFDEEHYQAFGADLLGRRALVHVTYSW